MIRSTEKLIPNVRSYLLVTYYLLSCAFILLSINSVSSPSTFDSSLMKLLRSKFEPIMEP